MHDDNDTTRHESDTSEADRRYAVAVDHKDEIDELGELQRKLSGQRRFSPDPDAWREGYPYAAKLQRKTYERI